MSSENNITVCIKVRPLLKQEKDCHWCVKDNYLQQIDNPRGDQEGFCFDKIFHETNEVFENVVQPIIHESMKGFNGTIFAYGQTSSGKTYTMVGDEKNPGIMTLVAREIFKLIEATIDREFLIRVSYIEIYNEKINDLLLKSNTDIKIKELNKEIYVPSSEYLVDSVDHILNLIEKGAADRKTGETNMNERSSRSHAIFRIIIESRACGNDTDEKIDEAVIESQLNLVDLAGSERVNQTGATGSRFTEGSHINKSLLALGCVIQQLSENEQHAFVNYRNSKLTRILQASLGGNAMTAIICTISPAALEETYSTLTFGTRAKKIRNKPVINEVVSDAVLLKRLERENIRLKKDLESIESDNERIKLLARIALNQEKVLTSTKSNRKSIANDESRRRTWCPSTIQKSPQLNDGGGGVAADNVSIKENKRETLQSFPCEKVPKHEIPKCLETDYILDDEEFYMNSECIKNNDLIFITPNQKQRKSRLTQEFDPTFVLTPMCIRELKHPKVYPSARKNLYVTPYKECISERLRQLKEEFEENYNFIQVEKKIVPKNEKLCLSNEREQLISFHRDLEVLYDDICLAAKNGNNDNVEDVFDGNKTCEKCASADVKLIDQEDDVCQRCEKLSTQIDDLTLELQKQKCATETIENEKNSKIQQLKLENNAIQQHADSIEYELDEHRKRAKNREKELIAKIDDHIVDQLRTENGQYINQLNDLEQKYFKMDAENVEMIEKLNRYAAAENNVESTLQKQINEMIISMTALQNEVQQYRELSDKLSNENSEWQSKYNHTETSLQQLQNQFDSLNNEHKLSNDTINQLNLDIKMKADEISSNVTVKMECHSIETQTDENFNKQLNDCQHTNNKLNEQICALNKKLKEIDAEREKVQTDYDELSTEIMDNLQEIDELKQKLCDTEIEINQLNQLKTDNDIEINNLRHKLDAAANDQLQMINELNDHKTNEKRLTENYEQLSCERTKLAEEMENIKTNHDIELKNVQQQQQNNEPSENNIIIELELSLAKEKEKSIKLQQEISDLELALNGVNQLYANEQATLVTLQEEKCALDVALKQQQDQHTELLSECGHLKSFKYKCEILESTVRQNEETLSKMTTDYTEAKIKLDELTAEHVSFEQSHKNETNELTDKCAKLQEKLAENQYEMEKLCETIQIKTNELQNLKCILETNSNSAELQSKYDAIAQVNKVLSEELAAYQQQNIAASTELETKVHHLERETANYQSKIDALINENKRLENDLLKTIGIVEVNQKVLQQTEDECNSIRLSFTNLMDEIKTIQDENETLTLNNKALNQEVCDLNGMINELESARQEIEHELTALERQNSQLETIEEQVSLEVYSDKVRNLEQQLYDMSMQRADFEQQIANLKMDLDSVSEIKQQNIDLKNELSVKQSNLKQMFSDREDFRQKIDIQTNQLDAYEKDNEQLLNELQCAKDQINANQIANKDLQNELIQEKSKFLEQENANKSNEAKIDELTHQISQLNENNLKNQQKIIDLEEMIKNERSKFNDESIHREHNSKDVINQLTAQIDQLKDDRSVILKEKQVIEQNLDRITVQVKKLENELKETSERVNEKEQRNNDFIENLTAQINHLKDDQSMILKDKQDIENNLFKLKVQQQQIENELKETNDKYSLLLTEQSSLQSQYDILKNSHMNCQTRQIEESKNLNLKSQIDELMVKIKTLQEEKRNLNDELKDIHSQYSSLLSEKTSLQSQYNTLKNDHKNCDQDILNLKRTNYQMNNYQTELGAAQKKIQQLEKELSSIDNSHKCRSEQSFAEKESKIRDLEKKLENLNNERDDLRQSQQNDRKSRRQSTHDSMRLFSMPMNDITMAFDANIQTDPTNELCSCTDMAAQITALKRDLLIKESQFYTYKMEMEIHPWHQEKLTMEKRLHEADQKNCTLRKELNRLTNEMQQTFPIPSVCSRCCTKKVKTFSNQMTQTQTEINMNAPMGSGIVYETDKMRLKTELNLVQKKYRQLKELLHMRSEKIQTLENEIETLKLKSSNGNVNPLNNSTGSDKENSVLKEKQNGDSKSSSSELPYFQPPDIEEEMRLKKIIDEMEIEITELKEQHEIQLNQLKEKYIAMKKFCETQKKHIKFLKEKETDAK